MGKRFEIRQKERTERRKAKYEAKYGAQAVAYQNGIDPHASMWGGLSSMTGSVAGGLSSVFGKGNNPTNAVYGGQSNKGIMYLAIALFALMIFKKGRL